MEKITVFDTYEQAGSTLEKYWAENEKIIGRIHTIGKEKERKYRKKTGYDEKLKELMKKPRTSHHHPIVPLNPSSIGLPLEERNKLRADVGIGLELICAIELNFYIENYHFNGEMIQQELSGYATINDLVNGIRKGMAEIVNGYYGATLNSFFYTVLEQPKITKEQMENIESSLLEFFTQSLLGDKESQERTYVRPVFPNLFESQARALNEEERAEFERLFYKTE